MSSNDNVNYYYLMRAKYESSHIRKYIGHKETDVIKTKVNIKNNKTYETSYTDDCVLYIVI